MNLATQLAVEDKYSRKNIRLQVLLDVDKEHKVFHDMVKKINAYRTGTYYSSKQTRIENISLTSAEIAEEILVSILPIKEVSPIQAVATQIAQQLNCSVLLDGVKIAAEVLAVCEETGAYTIYHASAYDNATGTLAIRSNYSLDDDTETFIKNTKYLPPMICYPSPWRANDLGGHLRGSGSVILGHLNHHKDYQALDVLNMLQSIEWSLNDIVNYDELPKKLLDTSEKRIQFDRMREESFTVYDELNAQGNVFHFVWKYDKRGRMYSQGYHCNLQGTEYKKAILNFTKKELIQ